MGYILSYISSTFVDVSASAHILPDEKYQRFCARMVKEAVWTSPLRFGNQKTAIFPRARGIPILFFPSKGAINGHNFTSKAVGREGELSEGSA